MNRRKFIQQLGVGSAGTVLLNPGMRCAYAQADPRDGRALVVIFLRGGCDGLNVVVPYGEDAYYEARPNIAIPPPSQNNPDAALKLDGFFGLHPALGPLLNLYFDGQLSLLPTVHMPITHRSHFENQALLEQAGGTYGDGWLNRYLSTATGTSGLNIGGALPTSLRGETQVSSYSDPFDLRFAGNDHDEELLDLIVDRAYLHPEASNSGPSMHWNDAALGLSADRSRAMPPEDASASSYPDNSFAQRLASASRLLKEDPELAVVSVDFNGWDTHSNQTGPNGRQTLQLDLLARSLVAFWTDLGVLRQKVAVVVQTEFGRTLLENASHGTDHGKAATWMVLSQTLNGGVLTGPMGWPGLSEWQLADGRYLAHTVDYRDVYAELLQAHLGFGDVPTVIPERPNEPVGLA